MKFLISSFIWWTLELPMTILSLPIVYILLLTNWEGKTTWFGNYKYGRKGNMHMPPNPTLFDEWRFLAIRNPVSNFGTQILSIKPNRTWGWLIDQHLFGKWYWLYGWKNPNDGLRTFVYRPWRHE